jgi:3-hydroxyacyl-[acyl-carrier-protein] dehydratase
VATKPDSVTSRLPHQSPYRFIDEVISFDEGEGVVCKKTIGGNEPYFAGHFPGHPVTPGVFEIEMMFQAASLFLMLEDRGKSTERIRLVRIENARFLSPIVPPRDLTISVTLKSREEPTFRFSGFVKDETEQYVQASFSIMRAEL